MYYMFNASMFKGLAFAVPEGYQILYNKRPSLIINESAVLTHVYMTEAIFWTSWWPPKKSLGCLVFLRFLFTRPTHIQHSTATKVEKITQIHWKISRPLFFINTQTRTKKVILVRMLKMTVALFLKQLRTWTKLLLRERGCSSWKWRAFSMSPIDALMNS